MTQIKWVICLHINWSDISARPFLASGLLVQLSCSNSVPLSLWHTGFFFVSFVFLFFAFFNRLQSGFSYKSKNRAAHTGLSMQYCWLKYRKCNWKTLLLSKKNGLADMLSSAWVGGTSSQCVCACVFRLFKPLRQFYFWSVTFSLPFRVLAPACTGTQCCCFVDWSGCLEKQSDLHFKNPQRIQMFQGMRCVFRRFVLTAYRYVSRYVSPVERRSGRWRIAAGPNALYLHCDCSLDTILEISSKHNYNTDSIQYMILPWVNSVC